MLIIHYVNPTGFFSYGKSENILLDQVKKVHLRGDNRDRTGESNGSGKTSLFNTVCDLLYGKNPSGLSGAAIVNTIWGRGCCGRLEFTSWENIRYRVTSCRDWKERLFAADNSNSTEYKGTSLYLEKLSDGVWEDCRGSSIAATRQRVVDALGLPYERFLSVSYMSPRVANSLLRGTNKERMDLLCGVAGLDEWDLVLSGAKKEKKSRVDKINYLEQSIARVMGEISQIKKQIADIEATDWKKKLFEYNQSLVQFEEYVAELRGNLTVLGEKNKELSRKKSDTFNQANISGVQEEIQKIMLESTSLNHGLYSLDMKEDTRLRKEYDQRIDALKEEHSSLTNEQGTVRGKLSSYKDEVGAFAEKDKCPTCGAKITKTKKESISKKVKGLEKELTDISEKLVELEKRRQKEHTENKQLRDAHKALVEKKKKELAKKLEKKQQERIDLLAGVQELDKALEENATQLNETNVEFANSEAKLREIRSYMNIAQRNLDKLDSLVEEKNTKESGVSGTRESIDKNKDYCRILDWIISNTPYIKLHKLSLSLSEISNLTNKYLSDMGDTIRVSLSAFDEKKKKTTGDMVDLLKSELKVTLIDGSKMIDTKLYSDGETSRVAIALTRALHEFSKKSGYGCNLLLLDEIFSFVDTGNAQKLAESFDSCTDLTVLFTDNSGKVSDLINFDETWTAVKQNGITTLEV